VIASATISEMTFGRIVFPAMLLTASAQSNLFAGKAGYASAILSVWICEIWREGIDGIIYSRSSVGMMCAGERKDWENIRKVSILVGCRIIVGAVTFREAQSTKYSPKKIIKYNAHQLFNHYTMR
jgi:hypothetical protein